MKEITYLRLLKADIDKLYYNSKKSIFDYKHHKKPFPTIELLAKEIYALHLCIDSHGFDFICINTKYNTFMWAYKIISGIDKYQMHIITLEHEYLAYCEV